MTRLGRPRRAAAAVALVAATCTFALTPGLASAATGVEYGLGAHPVAGPRGIEGSGKSGTAPAVVSPQGIEGTGRHGVIAPDGIQGTGRSGVVGAVSDPQGIQGSGK